MKLSKTIIIAAGGSGGHLFPALALADSLKKTCLFDRQTDRQIILLISSKEIDKKIAVLRDYSTEIIHFSFLKASRILNKYKPAVVVGFGGKNSIPLLLLSVFKRIPALIHEQNVLPGKANWFLSKFVNKIAISFYGSKRFFPRRKIVFTGNPLRRDIFAEGLSKESVLLEKTTQNKKEKNPEKFTPLEKNTCYQNEGFDRTIEHFVKKGSLMRFVILIMGGSQGAHKINTVVLDSLKEMTCSERDCLCVIHLCGETDYSFLKKEYSQLGIKYSLFPFLDKMGRAYASADLVVSRAGATSIAELIAFKKASVLVPYPYASGHQKANADLLFSKNAGLMVEEKDFNPQYLRQTILELKNNPEKIIKIKKNLEQFVVNNADELLAEEVVKIAHSL